MEFGFLVYIQVFKESIDPDELYNFESCGRSISQNSAEALAARVSSKLEEGDYKGEVRLVCRSATIAEQYTSTIEAMKLTPPPMISEFHWQSTSPDSLWVHHRCRLN